MAGAMKQEYIGAVTLVHFSLDGSLLYVGMGSTLYLYATHTGELVAKHAIMTRGILHGIDFGASPQLLHVRGLLHSPATLGLL